MREYIAVYVMTNAANSVLYVGVTSNLSKRAYEHRKQVVDGFTKRYGCSKLVYFEPYESIEMAIKREKRLKKYTHVQKMKLIDGINPHWQDLFEEINA